jgi:hypothetical protein
MVQQRLFVGTNDRLLSVYAPAISRRRVVIINYFAVLNQLLVEL